MIPQIHRADVYRATITQGTAQEISAYTLVYEDVPCFIQPMDSQESWFYEQRGLEDMHVIYTSAVGNTYQRNDILEYQGNQYHVVGVKNGLMMNVYSELSAYAYPEGAKKRLSRESYE
jgi:hypothetical protein